MQAVSDEQLIEWVAQGDASCLGTLFERHHRAVYRYCRQMTRNDTLAEDLVQDIFLKILKKARTFRREGTFRGWLFNIARNVTLDHLRRSQRRAASGTDDGNDGLEPVDEISAEQCASGDQAMNTVLQALAALPAAVQEVIWLGRFEFDSYEELGQALGCKAGAARVRMHRAMQQLNAACATINGATIDV